MQVSSFVARSILFWCAGSATAGPCYDVEYVFAPLCPFWDYQWLSPADIAPDGTIVGSQRQCDLGPDNAFIWKPAEPLFTIPHMTPGVISQSANAINSRGQIAMLIDFDGDSVAGFPFIYTMSTGQFVVAGWIDGATDVTPHGMNDFGDVAGRWGNVLVGPNPVAFVAQDLIAIDLHHALSGSKSWAFDINNKRQAVGWSSRPMPGGALEEKAFLWDRGRVIELGPVPGGTTSESRAINQLGQMAVSGSIPNPSGAGLLGRAYIWEYGRWTHLGLLPGYSSCSAMELNDVPQVIGNCLNPGSTKYVWQNGIMYNLPQRVVNTGDVTITSVRAINNAGQIAALGKKLHPTPLFGMVDVVVRLVPRPPQPADLTDDCHVNGPDLMVLLKSWGPIGRKDAAPAADLNHDGVVNGLDLAMLLAHWG